MVTVVTMVVEFKPKFVLSQTQDQTYAGLVTNLCQT